MLLLILANGHAVGIVRQNVRGHQDRVSEKPCVRRQAFREFFLVRVAALQKAHGAARQKEPRQLGHFRNVGLNEKRGFFRVQADREEIDRHVERRLAEALFVADGRQRVQIGNEVKRVFAFALKRDVLAVRAEIVSPVRISGRLNA